MRKITTTLCGKVVVAIAAVVFGVGSAQAANITWVGPNGSFWDLAANWNPGLPGAADAALLGANNTVFRSGAITIQSFTGTGQLSVTGGTLAVTAASSIGSLSMTSGSLGGTGNITVSGATAISFGDMRGTGTTTLQGATTISSSGLRLDGGRVLRNENTVTWDGGQILYNNTFNGTSGGAGSGTINNIAGATFIASGDSATSIAASNFGGADTGADALFTNAGTFRKSGSAANNTTTVGVAFNNTGAVQVQTGILNLTNGGTHTGNFDVTAGAVLGFGGGTHNVNAGAVTSPGTVRVSGNAVVNVNTAYNIAGITEIQSGFLNLLGGNATTGALIQSSGSVTGSNNFTVTGASTITFGDHRGTGTTTLQGATTISSSGLRLDGGRVLRNENTVTWDGGQILYNNTFNGTSGGAGSGTINNIAGATFIASGDSATSIAASNFGGADTGADALFTNAGTFRKSGSAANNTTTVGVAFNNTGAVQVQTGILNLTNGGTHTGNFDVTAGAVLGFGGGTHNVNAGAVTSPGTVRVSGNAVVNVNTAYNIAGITEIQSGFLNLLGGNATTGALIQSSGSVTGSNNFTVTGASTITFGDHRGTGTTTLQGATTISSSGLRLDGGRVLRNENTVTWDGGQILYNNTFNGTSGGAGSGTINNIAGATFIASGDSATSIAASNFGGADTGADALFTNAGTFRKSGSAANNTTTVGVAFNNTGAVQVQTGILNLTNGGTHTGNFDVTAGAVLGFGGGTHNVNAGAVTSPGTVRVSGNAVVNVNTAYNIAGITEIQSGFLNLLGGNATTGALIQSSGSVTGSNNFTVTGASTITFGDHRGTGTTTLQGATTISSSGLRLDGGRVLRNENTVTWDGGQILYNNTFNGTSGGAGSGTINNIAGATFIASGDSATSIAASNFGGADTGADALFTNAGTFRKSGSAANNTTTINVIFNNTGLVDVQTGVLSFSNGVQGVTGAAQTAAGAQLTLGAASTVGTLINNGTLNLGTNTVTVFTDYNNANFGSGNAFNRRAGVTGTGQIVAGGNAAQAITGANVTNGTTTNATLTIGNVRVGANTFNYQVANTGTTGPTLRGAIQTNVNGANITDARLSGTGVTPSNYNAGAPGANSGNLGVTFTAATAGALAPLSGQVLNLRSNFENIPDQKLNIALGAGAAAYNAAVGSVSPSPTVTIANQRVLGNTQTVLTVTNTAPGGVFTERLNASFTANTGDAINNLGTVSLLAAGASNNTNMSVGVNTATAGAKTGTMTIGFQSDGTGTSGLSAISAGSQVITVNGNVYQVAQGQLNTAPLNFGTVQVGQSVSQTLSISNIATGANGFVEDLNATFGATSGTGAALISGTGSLNGVLAGQTSSGANGTMTVNVNTAAAGTVNGAIAVNFITAGAVNGVSNGLGQAGVGQASYGVQGNINTVVNVINQASPLVNTPTINLGNVRVGAVSPTANVSITNVATVAPQAALNASISGNAPITATGSFNLLAPGATNNTSLSVGMNTGTAGAINGTATIAFVSDANNVGNCAPNCQLNLANQNVNVTGEVYRLANPTNVTPNVTLAARVGGTASGNISITNASPDVFTEALKIVSGVAPTGFALGANPGNIAAQGTGNLAVNLNTATAGTFGGTVNLAHFSTGAGTTGAGDVQVGISTVNLAGKVYQTAGFNFQNVNFGIVHVGDVVSRGISVTNNAPVTALNDTLRASVGAASTGGFTTSGGPVSGLTAGNTDNTTLRVTLNTLGNAGNFSGNASLAFTSQNPDLADLSLGSVQVGFDAQVNKYANAVFDKVSGAGNLTRSGNIFTLDFGTVFQGSGNLNAILDVDNLVNGGPADLLDGSLNVTDGNDFTTLLNGAFQDVVADGSSGDLLSFLFNTANLGLFTDQIALTWFGHNASGYQDQNSIYTLLVRGNVIEANGNVPEPSSLLLMIIALAGFGATRRRKTA